MCIGVHVVDEELQGGLRGRGDHEHCSQQMCVHHAANFLFLFFFTLLASVVEEVVRIGKSVREIKDETELVVDITSEPGTRRDLCRVNFTTLGGLHGSVACSYC